MLKKTTLIFPLVLLAISTLAQHTRIETDFSADIWKKLELSFSPEVRFNEGFELNEYFAESSLEYEFHKFFQFAAGYRFGFNVNKKNEHESFGRFHVDAKSGIKLKNFNPKIRIRFTDADDFGEEDAVTKYLRYRIELEYKIDQLNMEPYMLYEWYQDLDEKKFTKTRFECGIMQTINKHHKIGVNFRIHNYIESKKDTRYIIGIAYKFNL